jgi:TPR repeat protein
MYALGEGVQASNAVAAKWFQKATDHGSAAGMYNLGGMYENGRGVPKDLDRAMQLYRQAALLGNSQALRRLTQKAGPK